MSNSKKSNNSKKENFFKKYGTFLVIAALLIIFVIVAVATKDTDTGSKNEETVFVSMGVSEWQEAVKGEDVMVTTLAQTTCSWCNQFKPVIQKVAEDNNVEVVWKYPLTVAWRLEKNCNVISQHLNEGEEVTFAFAAQNNNSTFNIFNTCIVALTTERLLIGYKRVVFGYYFVSITPDLYNDLEIRNGIIWARLIIDTVKEKVDLSNIQTAALIDIETEITEFMIREKQKYARMSK